MFMKKVLLWLGMVLPCVCVADAAEGRMVFAHYMVCMPAYGHDSTLQDYQREMRDALAAGIDGFALNCGAWSLLEPHYKRRTLIIYQAAKELEADFKLFISADFAGQLAHEEFKEMVDLFRDHPNQFRYKGKPVLSTFGGGTNETIFLRETFGDSVVYVPFYYPTPPSENPNAAQVDQVFNDSHKQVDGFFHFGAAGFPDEIVASNRRLAQKWRGAGKLFMASVTPFYLGRGGNYRVYESDGLESMARQWEGAIRDDANWVEILTWNDWGECSYIAPFGEPTFTNLYRGHWGAVMPHIGFCKATRYYADWFKTGKPPTLEEETICYTYRLHPKHLEHPRKNPRTKLDEVARPGHADRLREDVFATVFLAEDAKLTIHSGATHKDFSLTAGVSHVSMPFQPGPQRFVLTRNNEVLIDKVGEFEISATDTSSNFNVFSGAASVPRRKF